MRHRFTGDDRPPHRWRQIGEARWLVARLLRGRGHLEPRGPENGPPALVIPGFLASDRTCLELRRALAERGWRAYPWDLGLNRGATPDILRHLRQRLEVIFDGRPVLLVGWSLGGLYARELAREAPHLVRAVVTLGSPFSGHPRQNNVWRLYEWIAGHPVDDPPASHSADKPPVPTLAIWSPKDGIVSRRSARGLDGERDEQVAVGGGHMAFGISRRTTRQIAGEIGKFLFRTEGKSPTESRG